MRVEYEFKNPDELEAVLTIRMTVAEFKELRSQLAEKWPSWKIGSAITDVVSRAQEAFEKRVEAE